MAEFSNFRDALQKNQFIMTSVHYDDITSVILAQFSNVSLHFQILGQNKFEILPFLPLIFITTIEKMRSKKSPSEIFLDFLLIQSNYDVTQRLWQGKR